MKRKKRLALVDYYIRRSASVVHYWYEGDGAFRRLCDNDTIINPSNPENEADFCDMCQDMVWRDLFLGSKRLQGRV